MIGFDLFTPPSSSGVTVTVGGHPAESVLAEHGLLSIREIWQRWAGGLHSPRWQDVDLLEIPKNLRQGTMVADFLPDSEDFEIRYWGIGLTKAFGIDLTAQRLSASSDNGIMKSFRESAVEAIQNRMPQFLMHEITSLSGVKRDFPVIRLPILGDGDALAKVMTVENVALCLQTPE